MSTDHLTAVTPQRLAALALAVLTGADLQTTAAAADIDPLDLEDAVQAYQAAGLAALEQRAEQEWYPVRIQFPSWETAEKAAATRLGPRLVQLQVDGTVADWWFVRKYPYWRLRLRGAAPAAVDQVLNELTTAGVFTRWSPTQYEPETAAFGGPDGMSTAHDLFCADSHGVLEYLRRPTPGIGRRELSILMTNALITAAGLDWFERGDVFDRVARMRPAPSGTDAARLDSLTAQLRTLLTVPAQPGSALFAPGGPCAFAVPWLAASVTLGHRLGIAAAHDRLDRGLRAVLAQTLIFHWNRFGLSAATQGILARAATAAFLPRD